MNDFKPVLGIETSAELCSAALITGGGNFYSLDFRQKHIHSEKLIPMIELLLNEASVKAGDLSYVAVSMGPGSFTGLRIGLSSVKGIAFGAGIGICPVPTFDAFAYYICRFIPDGTSFVITREVNTEELYAARFIKANGSYNYVNTLQILKKSEFNNFKMEKDLIFGNSGIVEDQNIIKDVNAVAVAEWSIKFGSGMIINDFDYLEPDYIKKFEGRKSNG